MKNLWYAATLFLSLLVASCSGGSGNSPKKISPASTEFTSGELARYVEIVNEPCELIYAEQEGIIGSQTFRLKTTLKLTKDGYSGVDSHDIDFTSLWSVALVKLTDNSGAELLELEIEDTSLPKLKKLLTGKSGDTAEIVFAKECHNSDDAPKWYEKASEFSAYLSADIAVQNNNETAATKVPEVPKVQEAPTIALENVKLPSSLKGKVEVVEVSRFVGDYNYPTVSVTFKLLKTVNTAPLCSEYGQMWLVGVGQTENGSNVRELLPNYEEWRSDDSDGEQFKAFLESEPGETICMEFSGDNEKSMDVAADLEKVKTFKLKITN